MDGRSNRRNKAVFSNVSVLVWTESKKSPKMYSVTYFRWLSYYLVAFLVRKGGVPYIDFIGMSGPQGVLFVAVLV